MVVTIMILISILSLCVAVFDNIYEIKKLKKKVETLEKTIQELTKK